MAAPRPPSRRSPGWSASGRATGTPTTPAASTTPRSPAPSAMPRAWWARLSSSAGAARSSPATPRRSTRPPSPSPAGSTSPRPQRRITEYFLASKYDGAYHGWILRIGSNLQPGISVTGSSTADVNVYSPTAIGLNSWYYLAATYDGSTVKLYIDGTLAASASLTNGYVPSATSLTIGSASWASIGYLNGTGQRVLGLQPGPDPDRDPGPVRQPGRSHLRPARLAGPRPERQRPCGQWDGGYRSLRVPERSSPGQCGHRRRLYHHCRTVAHPERFGLGRPGGV